MSDIKLKLNLDFNYLIFYCFIFMLDYMFLFHHHRHHHHHLLLLRIYFFLWLLFYHHAVLQFCTSYFVYTYISISI